MATKSTVKSANEHTVQDRIDIANAREVLQRFGLYVDVADMSDVSYEKRNCRMKALDLAVAAIATNDVQFTTVVTLANGFYEYIWEGKVA